MANKQKKSFTLIEMLIVIVIIGILAAALVPRLQSVQSRSRDTKRKVDLRSIYNANEIYFSDNNSYPLIGCGANGSGCAVTSYASQPWITELSGVMTSIPIDPTNTLGASYITGNYSYMYGWLYNNPKPTYDLIAQLENTKDTDRCELKRYKFNNDNNEWCVTFGGGYSKYIYDLSPNVRNSYQ